MQHFRAAPPLATSLQSPSETDTNTDRQQHDKQLYCGYCNVQYKTAVDLVKHCKQNCHKNAVFADSGRDVFWQFEPPPVEEDRISAALHG